MLDEMRIQGLGVIDDALLEFGPGFTVVTGETGAGKTMVVQGLGLLFGARGDAGLVRPGSGRALVEGRLRVDPDGAVALRAREAGAELDGSELIVSRSVSSEGRSRAHVGGRAVPLGVLGELADSLVAIHGQSDQQRLLRPSAQREALDRYGGAELSAALDSYAADYARYGKVAALVDELTRRARERAQEADLLRFGRSEIAAVSPQPGEDAALSAEIARLEHADALRGAAQLARAALTGDDDATDGGDALGFVVEARRALESAAALDPALADLARRAAEVGYLVTDLATDLASYGESIDSDPARLAAAHDRKGALVALTRKYGSDVDEVLAWSAQAAKRLGELDGDDERVAGAREELAGLRGRLAHLAGEISAARQAAAARFGDDVGAELAELAMPHARITVAITQRTDPDGLAMPGRTLAFGPAGVDEVELLLVPHPGAPSRPLARGASGGELSRVMLATEVVFAGVERLPTLVFDEVDAGVGGRAAVEVGRTLARLARHAQVIVVTHLPQVAAFADRHLAVHKNDDGEITRSGVTVLEPPARVRELSRMLAGLESSSLAQGHAEELLATAAAAKAAG